MKLKKTINGGEDGIKTWAITENIVDSFCDIYRNMEIYIEISQYIEQ